MGAYLYPALFASAVVLGMVVTEHLSRDRETSRKMYLAGIAAGIVGARLWYGVQYGGFLNPGGFSLYGFGLGAGLGVVLFHRLRCGRWAPSDFPDAAAPAFALGIAIHRWGCFFSGCCFGKPSDLPWAVQYAPGTPIFQSQVLRDMISPTAAATLPVHPTQVYSSLAALLVFGLLLWMRKSQLSLRRYELCLSAVILCGAYRFLIEFIRDDAGGLHLGWMTFSQATSLGLVLTAWGIFFGRRRGWFVP